MTQKQRKAYEQLQVSLDFLCKYKAQKETIFSLLKDIIDEYEINATPESKMIDKLTAEQDRNKMLEKRISDLEYQVFSDEKVKKSLNKRIYKLERELEWR